MEQLIEVLNSGIWSPALVYLCLGAGLFYSVITRFMQVRHMKEMLRLLFTRSDSPEGISSFQALAVALSGRVGMGNIAGVAAAIGLAAPVPYSGCGQPPFWARVPLISNLLWRRFTKKETKANTVAARLITLKNS